MRFQPLTQYTPFYLLVLHIGNNKTSNQNIVLWMIVKFFWIPWHFLYFGLFCQPICMCCHGEREKLPLNLVEGHHSRDWKKKIILIDTEVSSNSSTRPISFVKNILSKLTKVSYLKEFTSLSVVRLSFFYTELTTILFLLFTERN